MRLADMARRAAPAPETTDTATTTADAPMWRSIPALAERLNAGASRPTLTSHALRHYVRACG
jgi:hypothetical protein